MGRKYVTLALFGLYVGVCTVLPEYHSDSVSCLYGFYWEHHLAPFALFFITKVAELYFFAKDKSLDVKLPFFKFMLIFTVSMMHYSDPYQYSSGIQIAEACRKS